MTEAVVLALLPVVLLICLGSGLRWRRFLADSFWMQAERLGYFVLLPALFLNGVATAKLDALPIWALGKALVLSTVAVSVLVMLARPLTRLDGPAFTSVFQGGLRFNNYVGVPIAAGLYGAQGVALAAICNAAIVPTVNVLCILVFAKHGTVRLTTSGILKQVATNPLVLACLGGIVLQSLGVTLPRELEPALRALGAASLPLGLLCVGAALDFGSVRQWVAPVALSAVVKFVAMPAAMVAIGLPMGLHGPAFMVGLLFQALPTSSTAYIMARQLGGDAPLMAGITATQTVIAAATVPLILGWLTKLVPL